MAQMKQKGDAHTVVIVLLVVALLGALGFVFWQSYIKKDTSADNDTTTTTAQQPAMRTATIGSPFNKKYAVEYPESWKFNIETKGPVPAEKTEYDMKTTVETATFTSPSGDVQVQYVVSNAGGIGGMCQPEESPKLTEASFEKLNGVENVGLGIFSNEGTAGAPQLYRTTLLGRDDAKSLTDVKVGDSSCDVAFANFIELGPNDETTSSPIMTAHVTLPGKVKDGEVVGEADELRALYNSTDGEIAKQILRSTKAE